MKLRRIFTRARIQTALYLLACFALLDLLFLSILRNTWIGDLGVSHQPTYLLAGLIVIIGGLVTRKAAIALLGCIGTISPIVLIAPMYTGAGSIEPEAATLTVISTNIFGGRADLEAIAQDLIDADADVVCLQEYPHSAETRLVPHIADKYPYRYIHAPPDVMGQAIYSKHPLQDTERVWLGEHTYATLSATIVVDGVPVRIVNVHNIPPFSLKWYRKRNAEFRTLADMAKNYDTCIVAGDFNETVWSPHFHRFIERSGLTSARQGHGIVGTWPSIAGHRRPDPHPDRSHPHQGRHHHERHPNARHDEHRSLTPPRNAPHQTKLTSTKPLH